MNKTKRGDANMAEAVPNFQCPMCGKMSVITYRAARNESILIKLAFGEVIETHYKCLACGWDRVMS